MHRFLPPPVVMLVTAALMWLVAYGTPGLSVRLPGQGWLGLAVAVGGLALLLLAALELRRHRTTINPMHPESSEQLVTGGIYRLSRNPIYLADALMLTGWLIYLGNVPAVLLLPAFVVVIQRFQIVPEEQALAARFGEAFRTYMQQVRRWI